MHREKRQLSVGATVGGNGVHVYDNGSDKRLS